MLCRLVRPGRPVPVSPQVVASFRPGVVAPQGGLVIRTVLDRTKRERPPNGGAREYSGGGEFADELGERR